MTDLDEMWAALEAHQPIADARGYGLEWREMCRERTPESATAAGAAAGDTDWAAWAAAWAAARAAASLVDAEMWAKFAIERIARAEEAKP